MQTLRDISALHAQTAAWRQQGQSIALVPTMGNLHAGHLALMAAARAQADRVLATIFVNPIQFVAGEDFADYPRTEADDRRQLAEAGVDAVFMPTVTELFPAGQSRHTRVQVPDLDNVLCGASRPGHFTGVATIVTKLLNLTQPDVALFGEKDYQQLLVIRRLCTDLALPVRIVGLPTLREADGLALSSRNAYLSASERAIAPRLYEILTALATQLAADAEILTDESLTMLEAEACKQLASAGFQPDYVAIRHADDLRVPENGADRQNLRILAAAQLGRARLIDNVPVLLKHKP